MGLRVLPYNTIKGLYLCLLILGAVKGGLRVKGGVRAWGLVVAPWCVYIRQKLPRQVLEHSLGVIGGWKAFRRRQHLWRDYTLPTGGFQQR